MKLTKPQEKVVQLMAEGWELHVWMIFNGSVVDAELTCQSGSKKRRVKVYNKTLLTLIGKGVITHGHDVYKFDPLYPIPDGGHK